MTKYTFKPKDFKAFNVEGLDARNGSFKRIHTTTTP